MAKWDFPLKRSDACHLSLAAAIDEAPISWAVHRADGDWYFLDHMDKNTDLDNLGAMTSMGEIAQMLPSVLRLKDMPTGWIAHWLPTEDTWEVTDGNES